jgi:hypothetical protein
VVAAAGVIATPPPRARLPEGHVAFSVLNEVESLAPVVKTVW